MISADLVSLWLTNRGLPTEEDNIIKVLENTFGFKVIDYTVYVKFHELPSITHLYTDQHKGQFLDTTTDTPFRVVFTTTSSKRVTIDLVDKTIEEIKEEFKSVDEAFLDIHVTAYRGSPCY